jgi:ribosomal protein S18 acetylase RimI-like enzyme
MSAMAHEPPDETTVQVSTVQARTVQASTVQDALGSSLTLRRATHDDATALAKLAAATFALACPPELTQDDIAEHIAKNLSAQAFTRTLEQPNATVCVAQLCDSGVDPGGHSQPLIGYTVTESGSIDDADTASLLREYEPTTLVNLSKCYALPQQHGTGAAGKLLKFCLEQVRATQAAAIWAGTNQSNRRAIRFYEKHGFRIVGTRQFRVGRQICNDYVLVHDFCGD